MLSCPSLYGLQSRVYFKVNSMNLNITPIESIAEELATIDSFLNITMSEEVQEAVLRGNDLAVYIARTGKLLADAKYYLNGKKSPRCLTPYARQPPEPEQHQRP